MPETSGPGTAIDLERKTGLVSMGTHVLKIIRSGEKMGDSGYPFWMFTLRCEDSESQGRECLLIVSHSPESRFRVDEFLDATNAPQKGQMRHADFVGKLVRANIVHETYDGSLRAVPKKILPYDSQLPLPTETEGSAEPTGEIPEDTLSTPKRPAPTRSPSRSPFGG